MLDKVNFRAKTHERWIFMMINELPYQEYIAVLNMYLLKKKNKKKQSYEICETKEIKLKQKIDE